MTTWFPLTLLVKKHLTESSRFPPYIMVHQIFLKPLFFYIYSMHDLLVVLREIPLIIFRLVSPFKIHILQVPTSLDFSSAPLSQKVFSPSARDHLSRERERHRRSSNCTAPIFNSKRRQLSLQRCGCCGFYSLAHSAPQPSKPKECARILFFYLPTTARVTT